MTLFALLSTFMANRSRWRDNGRVRFFCCGRLSDGIFVARASAMYNARKGLVGDEVIAQRAR